jgi:hypothetical protein
VIPSGVSAPGPAGLVEQAGGGLVVVAESVRDDGSGHLKELLSDGGAAGGGYWDADPVEERGQVVGVEGPARVELQAVYEPFRRDRQRPLAEPAIRGRRSNTLRPRPFRQVYTQDHTTFKAPNGRSWTLNRKQFATPHKRK